LAKSRDQQYNSERITAFTLDTLFREKEMTYGTGKGPKELGLPKGKIFYRTVSRKVLFHLPFHLPKL